MYEVILSNAASLRPLFAGQEHQLAIQAVLAGAQRWCGCTQATRAQRNPRYKLTGCKRAGYNGPRS